MGAEPNRVVCDTLRTRVLEVVDAEGMPRIRALHIDEKNSTIFQMFDANGVTRACISVTKSGAPGIVLFDEHGEMVKVCSTED